MNLRFLLVIAVAVFLLLGCTAQEKQETDQNSQPKPIKTYECIGGKIVTDLQDCPKCPATCDDGNPCTVELCTSITNFSCVFVKLDGTACGKNGTCAEGVCNEPKAPAVVVNNTTEVAAPKEEGIVHLANESRQFIALINEKRMATLEREKTYLKEDSRLAFVAKKCNEEMLKGGKSDLTLCYHKYGSFKELLWKVGFYGDKFFYTSETNTTTINRTQMLFENLTENEQNLLINQSIDDLIINYPISVDSIGTSIDCDSKMCVETTITASNLEISRNSFQNYQTYTYTMLNFSDNNFIPIRFTLKHTPQSGDNIPYCMIYLYENKTYTEASCNYWWSDSWYKDRKHTYDRVIDWTDYYSQVIERPTVAYVFCYAEQGGGGTFEIDKEYLPKINYSQLDLESVLGEAAKKVSEEPDLNSNVVDLINRLRSRKNYSPLKNNEDLDLLADSVSYQSSQSGEYGLNLTKTFGNYTYAFAYQLALRDIFGNSAYSYRVIENVNSTLHQLDTIYTDDAWMLGDYTKNMEYFGSGITCEGDVCVSMFIIGSNQDDCIVNNTWKGNLYGYVASRYLKMGRGNFPLDRYPKISFNLNSSTKANYYTYKNKVDGEEVWRQIGDTRTWSPKDGYVDRTFEPKMNYSRDLDPSVYFIVYEPILEDNQYGSFNFSIRYIPPR